MTISESDVIKLSVAQQYREFRDALISRRQQLQTELEEINSVLDAPKKSIGRPRGSKNRKQDPAK